jgi:hypothetical protein
LRNDAQSILQGQETGLSARGVLLQWRRRER